MAQQSTLLPAPQQLAIGYDGGSSASMTSNFPADGATSTWGAQSVTSHAGAFYAPSNRPTPEIPL